MFPVTWDEFVKLFFAALATPEVRFILFGIAADVIASIAASIKTGEFRLGYVANFIKSKLAPYILGFVAAKMIATVQPDLSTLPTIIWGAIQIALLGDVLAALKELGLPIPEQLTKPHELWDYITATECDADDVPEM